MITERTLDKLMDVLDEIPWTPDDGPEKLAGLKKRFEDISSEAIREDVSDNLKHSLELIGTLLSWLETQPPCDDKFKLVIGEIAETYAFDLQSNLKGGQEPIDID